MPTPTMTPDENIQRTIHDYRGPLAFMPNEPRRVGETGGFMILSLDLFILCLVQIILSLIKQGISILDAPIISIPDPY